VSIYGIVGKILNGSVREQRYVQKMRPLLLNLDHFAAFVLAAMGTNTMSADFLVAIGALGELRHLESVVSTAGRGTPL
jgi:hypothetical protein